MLPAERLRAIDDAQPQRATAGDERITNWSTSNAKGWRARGSNLIASNPPFAAIDGDKTATAVTQGQSTTACRVWLIHRRPPKLAPLPLLPPFTCQLAAAPSPAGKCASFVSPILGAAFDWWALDMGNASLISGVTITRRNEYSGARSYIICSLGRAFHSAAVAAWRQPALLPGLAPWRRQARLSSALAPPAHCAAGDIPALRIYVGDTEPTGQASVLNNTLCADYKASAAANASIDAISVNCTSVLSRAVSGRYLIISAPTDPTGRAWMTLCEVEPRIASGGACTSVPRVRRLSVRRA
jgi:hypothetical protein